MVEEGNVRIEGIIDRNTEENGDNSGGKVRRKRNNNTSTRAAEAAGDFTGEETGVIGKNIEVPILDYSDIPTPEAPKKRARKPKETEASILEENIESLLKIGFQMAAVRLGEHWNITDEESKLVSKPTARIMNRLNVTQTANKYMDYITLVSALGVIVVPRILAGGVNKHESRKIEAINSEVVTREQKAVSASNDIRNAIDNAIIED